MNDMRKLIETIEHLSEGPGNQLYVKVSSKKYNTNKPEDIPGQYSDWREVEPEFFNTLALELRKFGLKVYVLEDTKHDGYFWWVSK
jgi:hypothetical protein